MIDTYLGGIRRRLFLLVVVRIGSALCRSLVAKNHDVVLIRQDEAVLSSHLTKRYDIIGILEMELILKFRASKY